LRVRNESTDRYYWQSCGRPRGASKCLL